VFSNSSGVVWIRPWLPYFNVFSSALVPIEKIYQTPKTVFDHVSKHLEVRQKYSCLFGVCKTVSLECKEMQKNKKKGLADSSTAEKKNTLIPVELTKFSTFQTGTVKL